MALTDTPWTFPVDPFLAPEGETFEQVMAEVASDARRTQQVFTQPDEDGLRMLTTLYGEERARHLMALCPPF